MEALVLDQRLGVELGAAKNEPDGVDRLGYYLVSQVPAQEGWIANLPS